MKGITIYLHSTRMVVDLGTRGQLDRWTQLSGTIGP